MGLFKYPKRHLRKLIKEGEYREAIDFGKTLEPKYSDDYDFMFIMGSIFFIVEDAKKALPYFEKSLQLNNNDIETLTLKTNTHLALQQKEEAIECCKHILKLQPSNQEAKDLLDDLVNV